MVDDIQSIDGYKCSCGFITDDKTKFLLHIAQGNRRDGKGFHKSQGRVNVVTGEITMPPYKERTLEQKNESNFGRKALKLGPTGKTSVIRTTDILSQASEIKFIPRIYTTTYTPIMQAAQDAAVKYFGWRPNMPFENFIDTVLFLYFKEHDVELGAYHVGESLVKARQGAIEEKPEPEEQPYPEIES